MLNFPVDPVEVVAEKSSKNNSSTPSSPTTAKGRTVIATDNTIFDSETTGATATNSSVNTNIESSATDTTPERRFTTGNYRDSTVMTISVSMLAAISALGFSNGIISFGAHTGAAAATAQATAVLATFGGGISGFTQAKKSVIEIQN